MSSSDLKHADISGIDWMISYISWRSRMLPSGGNHFSIVAQVADTFDFDKFSEKVFSLKHIKSFLSGRIKRQFPCWIPRWYYSHSAENGIVCRLVSEDREPELNNELPPGTSVEIVYFLQKKKLLCTFSHAVFDGVGAEKFILFLLSADTLDQQIERSIAADIPKMKQSGKELRELMEKIPEKKIFRLPPVSRRRKNEFRRISLAPEEYEELLAAVEKKYGPFSFSLYILSLILCKLEKTLFLADKVAEYVFVPMSVDLRSARQEENDMFFNHWSLMPLLVSRKVLTGGIPDTFQHLRKLYIQALSSRTAQLFFDGAEAMKYIPYFCIDTLVRFQPGKTLGTFMFSFLNSPTDSGEKLSNLAHYPAMPHGNNLGFFANVYNGHFNLVISRRPWQNDEGFENFVLEIEQELREKMI